MSGRRRIGPRHITELEWARELPSRPLCIPQSRPRGTKALGIRYEKCVARAIPGAKHGLWYEFSDANGHGYCQPDIVFPGAELTLVLECKLTDTPTAYEQLARLYCPIVERIYGKPSLGLIVVRHLTRTTPRDCICTSLVQGITLARSNPNITPIVHWLGHGPIG